MVGSADLYCACMDDVRAAENEDVRDGTLSNMLSLR
jgi:hypothetical protein